MKTTNKKTGFTLIELTIVLTIISLIFLGTVLTINPLVTYAESRNARRWSDINALMNAFYQLVIDTKEIPVQLSAQPQQIGTAQSGCDKSCVGAASTCLDARGLLAEYLSVLPNDPAAGSPERTGYSVVINENNSITVKACGAENNSSILLTR